MVPFFLCVFLPFCPKGYNHDEKGEEKWWRLEKNLNLVDPLAVANQFLEEQVSGSYGTGSAKIRVQDIPGSRHKTSGTSSGQVVSHSWKERFKINVRGMKMCVLDGENFPVKS